MCSSDLAVIEMRHESGDLVDMIVVGAVQRRMDRQTHDLGSRCPHSVDQSMDDVRVDAVTIHRRTNLHEGPPAARRRDVLVGADGDDRIGTQVGRRSGEWGEYHRNAIGRNGVGLVGGADRDVVGDQGSALGEPGSAEAVAIALDHRHRVGDPARDRGDVGFPGSAVDMQHQSHGWDATEVGQWVGGDENTTCLVGIRTIA